MEYSYRGEARSQNVMSFANPEVFKQVQELVGQTVEVELTKNDAGYSEWKSISVQSAGAGQTTTNGSGSSGTATATRVTGSNYETKEERAARQVLIVKQSSLSNALTFHKEAGNDLTEEQLLETAQRFTDWVLDTGESE